MRGGAILHSECLKTTGTRGDEKDVHKDCELVCISKCTRAHVGEARVVELLKNSVARGQLRKASPG